MWGQKVGHDGRLVSACFKSWFMDSNLTFVFSSVTSTESHVTLRKLNCWEQKKTSSSGLDFLRQCLGEMLVITRSRWTTQSDAASVDSWLLRLFLFTTHFTICNIQVNIPTYCPLPTSPPPLPQTSQPPAPLLVYHVLNTLSYSDVTLTKQSLLSDPRATSHRKLFKINTSYSEVPQWEYCCCPRFLVLIPVVQKHLEDEP